MNERRPLWQRILERHKYRGRLLRPRVPLVLLRLRRVGHDVERRKALQPRVTQYALNLHLQLNWPFVSIEGNTLHDTHLHSSFARDSVQSNSTRNFLWLMPSSQSNRYRLTSNSSLCNLSVLCASVVNNWSGKTTTETQRTQSLHREIRLSGQSFGLVLPQTRKLIQLLQQTNAINTSTHVFNNVSNESHVTNKSVEVQEARKIFAGMVRLHSNLATHITNRNSSTRVDLQKEINDDPKIATRPPSSASTQLKLAAVTEHHRVVKSSKSIASDLTTFHSRRAEHDVLQHTTVFRTQHVNTETPISRLHSTVGTQRALLQQRGQAPLPDLFFPERVNNRTSQEGRLAPAALYTQPVARNFVTQPSREETRSQARTVPSASPQTITPTQQQPSLDIGRLTDEVYRHIQRKIRVERERRGL
ncbi:MAG TPA: hypothetical protein VE980_06130 [Pyrinomonadaceae bacterium]|nr:hypothetical protein [Pyrinomonadaceae bacterium]